MTRDERLGFRTTTWPGGPVPLPAPRFLTWGRLVDDGGRPACPEFVQMRRPDFEGDFGEVYLELVALDLDDDQAIVDFCLRYGVLGVYDENWPAALWDDRIFGFRGVPGFDDHVAPALTELRQELAIDYYTETISEFVWGAQVIKDLTTAWQILSGQISRKDAVWVAPCWAETLPKEVFPSWFASDYQALSKGIEVGLSPFGPTVHFVDSLDEEDEMPGGLGGAHPTHINAELRLASVLCLELFNHIAERSEYRRCANEPCGRLFVRQQGRAEHGQHRTSGVKYCSRNCARAQAQRLRRRRARAT